MDCKRLTCHGKDKDIHVELLVSEGNLVSGLKVNIVYDGEEEKEGKEKIEVKYNGKSIKAYHFYKDENTTFEIKFSKDYIQKPEVYFYINEKRWETEKEAVAKTINILLDFLPMFEETKEGVLNYIYSNLRKLDVTS